MSAWPLPLPSPCSARHRVESAGRSRRTFTRRNLVHLGHEFGIVEVLDVADAIEAEARRAVFAGGIGLAIALRRDVVARDRSNHPGGRRIERGAQPRAHVRECPVVVVGRAGGIPERRAAQPVVTERSAGSRRASGRTTSPARGRTPRPEARPRPAHRCNPALPAAHARITACGETARSAPPAIATTTSAAAGYRSRGGGSGRRRAWRRPAPAHGSGSRCRSFPGLWARSAGTALVGIAMTNSRRRIDLVRWAKASSTICNSASVPPDSGQATTKLVVDRSEIGGAPARCGGGWCPSGSATPRSTSDGAIARSPRVFVVARHDAAGAGASCARGMASYGLDAWMRSSAELSWSRKRRNNSHAGRASPVKNEINLRAPPPAHRLFRSARAGARPSRPDCADTRRCAPPDRRLP